MEQVFIIIAVLVFWIFKGVARAQRRVPGQDPYESEPLSSAGRPDVVGATRRATPEAQERAVEALRRWEEKQDLATGQEVSRSDESVPAALRVRPSVEMPAPAVLPVAREPGARTPEPRDDRPSRSVAPKPSKPEPAELDRSTPLPDAYSLSGSSARGALSRIEALPLAARAIVYSEIFGRPRYLS